MASSLHQLNPTSDEDFDSKQKRFFGVNLHHQPHHHYPLYTQSNFNVHDVSNQGNGTAAANPESKFFMSSLLNLHQNPNGGKDNLIHFLQLNI